MLAGRLAGDAPKWFAASFEWAVSDADACRLVEAAQSRISNTEHRGVAARLWLALSLVARGERSAVLARKAIAVFDEIGERSHWFGYGLVALQSAYRHTGEYAEALAVSDRVLALLRDLSATRSGFHQRALRLRAQHLNELRRYQECRQTLIDAISLSASPGDLHLSKVVLAELESNSGNVREAVVLADEAAAAYPFAIDPVGTKWELSTNRCNAAAYRLMLGEFQAARLAALEVLALVGRGRLMETMRHRAWATQHLAAVAALCGDPEGGARLRGYVDAWYITEGEVREQTEQRTYEILVAALAERLNETDIERLAAECALLEEDEAVDMALVIARASAPGG